MTKLISLTDFSEASKNAFRYAHALSLDLGGSLTVVHYYQDVKTTGHFKSMKDILKADAEKEMELMIREGRETVLQGSEVEGMVVEGDVTTRLRNLKDSQDHLVVMGSSGANKNLASVFGNTAKALINKISPPTLIVPPNCSYKKPQTMVVANDGMMTEINLIYLDLLANKLGAHLYFLHIGDIDIDHKSIDQYSTYLESCAYSFHNINAEDIVSGINKFAGSVQADIVVMAKNKRNLLQKIFSTSHTNEELFHSVIPLLVLHRDR